MLEIFSGNPRKVIVPREAIAKFNAQWPCSELRTSRHYWFEFDSSGDLVDCDVPQHDDDDGRAAAALAEDCLEFLETGELPAWCD